MGRARILLVGAALVASVIQWNQLSASDDATANEILGLVSECSTDSECSDAEKPHCCCGLTGTGGTFCRCQAACAP